MSTLSSFFLVGPTAVGKSSISHRIAEIDDLDIVSADSMLVYEGLDIGTAKPTKEERSAVRYWGIDIATPAEPFSVASYRDYAISSLKTIHQQGRMSIVVGGTGLYVKSLTHGLSRSSAPDPEVRTRLIGVLQEGGTQALQDMLRRDNAKLYDRISDKDNPRRLIRALERTQANEDRTHTHNWRNIGRGPCIVGLAMRSDQLRERIQSRVEAMYASGMADEVQGLLSAGLETAPTALQAIGYKEAIDYIRGNSTLPDSIARTAARTAQLAKRQSTWFRNQANVSWINIDIRDDMDTMIAKIKTAWEQHGPTPISE